MKTKITYIADDGEEFQDIGKCQEHERELKLGLQFDYDTLRNLIKPIVMSGNAEAVKQMIFAFGAEKMNDLTPLQRVKFAQIVQSYIKDNGISS